VIQKRVNVKLVGGYEQTSKPVTEDDLVRDGVTTEEGAADWNQFEARMGKALGHRDGYVAIVTEGGDTWLVASQRVDHIELQVEQVDE
jgi:hypothetical protein